MDTAINADFSSSHSISPSELATRMAGPDAPLLLDVRREAKFRESTHMLAGAQRCAPEDVAAFAAAHLAREVVVYCVYGHNVSADAAAALRAAGWQARFLAGGMEGGEEGVDSPADMAQWRATPTWGRVKRPDSGATGEQA